MSSAKNDPVAAFRDPELAKGIERAVQIAVSKEWVGDRPSTYSVMSDLYLKMQRSQATEVVEQSQFFPWVCKSIRNLLIDRARKRHALIRGGGVSKVPLEEAQPAGKLPMIERVEFAEIMSKLDQEDPEAAEVIDMRFVCGMTETEVAQALDISRSTVTARFLRAKGKLLADLGGSVE